MLNIRNLTKQYAGGKKAVDGLTLGVLMGEILGCLGVFGGG